MSSDTIAAISTPLGGEGSIAVIRISGPRALDITSRIFNPTTDGDFLANTLRHGWIMDRAKRVDEVMVAFMAGPKSYTGEDVVEISCHGGPAVVKNILQLVICGGARLAERGEFTKRAFLSGKIDLTQAEAVIDLIRARTKEASILHASHLSGSLSSRLMAVREELKAFLAQMEASIDFPDEISEIGRKQARSVIINAMKSISGMISTADMGRIFREGVAIAIAGRPNVGKSSLMNALLRHERAIVHEDPGTTRDTIEETINIRGIAARIVDMAGIRDTKYKVESQGVEKAFKALADADLAVVVIDASEKLTQEDKSVIERTEDMKRIFVLNKIDKKQVSKMEHLKAMTGKDSAVVEVSALKNTGIDVLEGAIFKEVSGDKSVARNIDVMINLRQKQCLSRANECLAKALGSVKEGMETDCVAIDLRGALAAMGEVTGEAVGAEVIDAVFERFCVGK